MQFPNIFSLPTQYNQLAQEDKLGLILCSFFIYLLLKKKVDYTRRPSYPL